MTGVGASSITSPRDLQRWMDDAREMLAERGVRALFGRGLDLSGRGGGASSWISFASDVGSGRIVRGDDGACRMDAVRHSDGYVLLGRSSSVTSAAELGEMVDALTSEDASP